MKAPILLAATFAALTSFHPNPVAAQNISPAAGPTTTPNSARPDGFIMVNGVVHVVQRGVATPLTQEMVLRVTPSAVIGFDGLPRRITPNAMLTMSGTIIAPPRGLTFAPLPPAFVDVSSDPFRLQDRWVEGYNSTGLAPAPRIAATPAPRVTGPRPVIAKKAGPKAKVTSRQLATKKSAKTAPPRSTAKTKTAPVTPVIAPLPPFPDETLLLPNHRLDPETGALAPIIDADNTMLNMTKLEERELSAEQQGIGGSLGEGHVIPAFESTSIPRQDPRQERPDKVETDKE